MRAAVFGFGLAWSAAWAVLFAVQLVAGLADGAELVLLARRCAGVLVHLMFVWLLLRHWAAVRALRRSSDRADMLHRARYVLWLDRRGARS